VGFCVRWEIEDNVMFVSVRSLVLYRCDEHRVGLIMLVKRKGPAISALATMACSEDRCCRIF